MHSTNMVTVTGTLPYQIGRLPQVWWWNLLPKTSLWQYTISQLSSVEGMTKLLPFVKCIGPVLNFISLNQQPMLKWVRCFFPRCIHPQGHLLYFFFMITVKFRWTKKRRMQYRLWWDMKNILPKPILQNRLQLIPHYSILVSLANESLP